VVEQAIARLREVLRGTDYEGKVYLVGGYVRDKLLNRPLPNDLDIVLEGDALALARWLYEHGVAEHAPVVYARFGTAMVKVAGVPIELVTARAESYRAESRKPIQVKPATLYEDALRRDFTINTNRQAKVHKKTAVDNPLLKVPPASRGNQDPSVPLAKRGEPKGGGQIVNFGRAIGIKCPAQRSTVRTVPTASVPPSRSDRARMVATSCAGGRVRGTNTAISTTAERGITFAVPAGLGRRWRGCFPAPSGRW